MKPERVQGVLNDRCRGFVYISHAGQLTVDPDERSGTAIGVIDKVQSRERATIKFFDPVGIDNWRERWHQE